MKSLFFMIFIFFTGCTSQQSQQKMLAIPTTKLEIQCHEVAQMEAVLLAKRYKTLNRYDLFSSRYNDCIEANHIPISLQQYSVGEAYQMDALKAIQFGDSYDDYCRIAFSFFLKSAKNNWITSKEQLAKAYSEDDYQYCYGFIQNDKEKALFWWKEVFEQQPSNYSAFNWLIENDIKNKLYYQEKHYIATESWIQLFILAGTYYQQLENDKKALELYNILLQNTAKEKFNPYNIVLRNKKSIESKMRNH